MPIRARTVYAMPAEYFPDTILPKYPEHPAPLEYSEYPAPLEYPEYPALSECP